MNKLNQYFTDNYQWLEKTAICLTSKINKRYLAPELISNCFIHLSEAYTPDMNNNQIKAIIINYMNMQVIWSNTQLKKSILKDNPEITIIENNDNEEEMLEKEFLFQNKINHIHKWVAQAKPEDRLLFDIVFNQGYNTSGKLAKHSGLSRTTCYTLITNLKNKIKKTFEE